jgi:hypothetical protein
MLKRDSENFEDILHLAANCDGAHVLAHCICICTNNYV